MDELVCATSELTSQAELAELTGPGAVGMGGEDEAAVRWGAREDDVNERHCAALAGAKTVAEPKGELPVVRGGGAMDRIVTRNDSKETQQRQVARRGGTMVGIVTRK